jgi:hypothetical protein
MSDSADRDGETLTDMCPDPVCAPCLSDELFAARGRLAQALMEVDQLRSALDALTTPDQPGSEDEG